jgi:hypothetical protein
MAYILHNDEKYVMKKWRIQCLKCSDILQTWDCTCFCGLIFIENGQRKWPYFPVKDVSIWTTTTGKILPQPILDHYFNLSRETNKASTNTETSTRASRSTN